MTSGLQTSMNGGLIPACIEYQACQLQPAEPRDDDYNCQIDLDRLPISYRAN